MRILGTGLIKPAGPIDCCVNASKTCVVATERATFGHALLCMTGAALVLEVLNDQDCSRGADYAEKKWREALHASARQLFTQRRDDDATADE